MVSSGQFGVLAKKGQRPLLTVLLWVYLLGGTCLVLGCGYLPKKPSYLQQIDAQANAFRMSVVKPFGPATEESVKEIRVFESETDANDRAVGRLCWEIIATTDVLAAGFELVAGQVPKDFTQIFPQPGEMFQPLPGRTYEITVVTFYPSAGPLGTKTRWVAK